MFWKKKKPSYLTPHITDDNFNEIVSTSKVPVLLDFYASWCGPCKVLGPIIDELSEEYQDKALVAKVNTEVNPQLSAYFKIKSCLLYTSPSPRDATLSRMPSSA